MAERRADAGEPWATDARTMDPLTRTMTSAFRFWLSFWPVAPLFGVEWRFAELAGKSDPRTGGPAGGRSEAAVEEAVALGAVPMAKAVEAASQIVEATAAPVEEAVEAAVEAAAEGVQPKTAPAADRADDLTQIKGVGPGLERQLNALGIRSFAQLAALSADEMAEIDEKLSSIKGRCFRDDWIGQAKELAD